MERIEEGGSLLFMKGTHNTQNTRSFLFACLGQNVFLGFQSETLDFSPLNYVNKSIFFQNIRKNLTKK